MPARGALVLAGQRALGVVIADVPDAMHIGPADAIRACVVMDRVDVPGVDFRLLARLEEPQVAGSQELEEKGVLRVVFDVAPVDDPFPPPVAEVEHAVLVEPAVEVAARQQPLQRLCGTFVVFDQENVLLHGPPLGKTRRKVVPFPFWLVNVRVPWIQVGCGLAADGRAMHRTLGNYLPAEPLVRTYGADAVRFFGASEAGPGEDFRNFKEVISMGNLGSLAFCLCEQMTAYEIAKRLQLLAQPAAGGPGVDHHLDLLERVGRVQAELGGQQAGQDLGPVAAKDRQQRGGLRGRGSWPGRGTGPSSAGLRPPGC